MPSCLAALYPSKRACARGALLLSFIKYAYLSLVVKLRFAFIYRKFHWRAGRRSLVQATSIDLLSKSSQAVSGWKPAGQRVVVKQASDRKIGNHEYNIAIPEKWKLEQGKPTKDAFHFQTVPRASKDFTLKVKVRVVEENWP